MIYFTYLSMAELFCYDVDDSTGNIDFFYNVAGQLVTQSFFAIAMTFPWSHPWKR